MSPQYVFLYKLIIFSIFGTLSVVLLATFIVVRNEEVKEVDDIVVPPSEPSSLPLLLEDTNEELDMGYETCVMQPSKSFCFPSAQKQQLVDQADQAEVDSNDLEPQTGPKRHPLHRLVRAFHELASSLGLANPVLLEPSILFCALPPAHKFDLLVRGFNPKRLKGSFKVVTIGLFERDAALLDQEKSVSAAEESGFRVSRIRRWLDFVPSTGSDTDLFRTTHIFLARRTLTVHCVVFFERGRYLWHDDLSADGFRLKDVLLSKEGAYDSFQTILLDLKSDPDLRVRIPSRPFHFLIQAADSRFIGCPPGRTPSSAPPHPTLTPAEIRNRTAVALRELRSLLRPHSARFWLRAETHAGWLQHCDIFSNSTDLNLSLERFRMKDRNLTDLFHQNAYLKVVEAADPDSGLELDCDGLRIHISVCDLTGNECWGESHLELTRTHPHSHLCTSEVFGCLVNIPCLDTKREDSQKYD